MDATEEISFLERKRQALTRRADKLMEWLHRPKYADYINEESTVHLVKLIDLIIYALQASIPKNEWRRFYVPFRKARKMIAGIPDDDTPITAENEKANYDKAITLLLTTLEKYRAHIQGLATTTYLT